MATRRLLKERSSFEKDPLEFVSLLEFVNEDVFDWRVSLLGPPNTPYQGGTFVLSVSCPTQYPFKPPKISFQTKIFHPSVDMKTGSVCADVVGQGWGPTLNIRHVLSMIYQMLVEPNPDHPLEDDIATLLREKPKEFERKAKKYTKEHAK